MMQDFQDHISVNISGKTHLAMIAFLKKHNADSHDLSRFVEDAVTWRILDREIAFKNAGKNEDIPLFQRSTYEKASAE
jgi:hypothetical protein